MKKIVIFTCPAGGGHSSVSNALEEQLKGHYVVSQAFIFTDVLGSIDPLNYISRGRYNGEMIYNWFIRRRMYWALNNLAQFGSGLYSFFAPRVERRIEEFLKKEKPDLVISVIPFVNSSILAVTKKLDLPFIVIPTDLDATLFLTGPKNSNYEKLYFTLPFENQLIKQSIEKAHIPADKLYVTGFVLRPAFFTPKDENKIKEEFNIPLGKPVVMVMTGAVGSVTSYYFTQELVKCEQPVHLVICIGKNESLRKKIEELELPKHVSMTIVGFTDRVAELMSVSDLFVTKSGSVSFCEGMYMNIPMLLDATATVMDWEKLNHEIAEKYEFGKSVKSNEEIRHVVESLIANPEALAIMRQNLENMNKKRGCLEIKKLIKAIIS
jgi:processive 1,2-diacylglycerol beta-glucosyltransferase